MDSSRMPNARPLPIANRCQPDGRETQRIGIVPDIEVKPTIKGIKEGRDELLEKALAIIDGK